MKTIFIILFVALTFAMSAASGITLSNSDSSTGNTTSVSIDDALLTITGNDANSSQVKLDATGLGLLGAPYLVAQGGQVYYLKVDNAGNLFTSVTP